MIIIIHIKPLYPYYVLNAWFRYGEGWDFGEVAKNGRGTNASQSNVSNTGIGRYMILYIFIVFCQEVIFFLVF